MSNETIVIFKNDAVGDLVHSIPAIHKIIENSGDKKITVFLSKRSKNFSFLINGKNIAIKILNYDLTLYDKFLILKYLFNNKIKNAYILTPKNFYYFLPLIFKKIKFFAICVNNINNYKRPSEFFRKFLFRYVINNRALKMRKSSSEIQIELINNGINEVTTYNYQSFLKVNTNTIKILPKNYIYFHFTKNKFHRLGWGINEVLILLKELKKYNKFIFVTKDIEKDKYDDLFKKNFNYYNFKSNQFINNQKNIYFLDDIEGLNLFNIIGYAENIVACHGMVTNLASLLNKPVLDIFDFRMETPELYRTARSSFYEFKPKYKGYNFILPKRNINKILKKFKFALTKS